MIVVWAVTGPIFGFSDTWQLVINTSTTIVTFLMVFVIQNSQNRDSKAVHIKLDELIEAMEGARNRDRARRSRRPTKSRTATSRTWPRGPRTRTSSSARAPVSGMKEAETD